MSSSQRTKALPSIISMLRKRSVLVLLPKLTLCCSCRRKRSVIYRRLRGSWFKSKYLALLSGFLLFSSALLFTVDLFYLRGRNTVDSETKTHESLFSFLWPVGLPNRTDSWENENSKTMHALFKCVSDDSCRENQTSVVLLSSEHFANSIAGRVSGEDIWCVFCVRNH